MSFVQSCHRSGYNIIIIYDCATFTRKPLPFHTIYNKTFDAKRGGFNQAKNNCKKDFFLKSFPSLQHFIFLKNET